MQFNCPHCNQLIKTDDSSATKLIECPICSLELRVPSVEEYYMANNDEEPLNDDQSSIRIESKRNKFSWVIGGVIIITTILFFFFIHKQTKEVNALKNLRNSVTEYSDALIEKDYPKMVSFILPTVIEQAGGAKKMIEIMETVFPSIEDPMGFNMIWSEYEYKIPDSFVKYKDSEWGCVIETKTPFLMDNEKGTLYGSEIAVSFDQGKSWFMVSGSKVGRTQLANDLPGLYQKLDLPENLIELRGIKSPIDEFNLPINDQAMDIDPMDRLQETISNYDKALREGDYPRMIDFILPSAVELAGGSEKMEELIEKMYSPEDPLGLGFTLDKFGSKFQFPNPIVEHNEFLWVCLVPMSGTGEYSNSGDTAKIFSTIICLSNNQGKSWSLIQSSDFAKTHLSEKYPSLFENLEIPQDYIELNGEIIKVE